MSTKQMAYAARDGKRLTLNTSVGSVTGYLVGMDDYHWLIAEVTETSEVCVSLVHKGLTPHARISRMPLLSDETPAIQAAVREAGGAFFSWCERFLTAPAEPAQN